jgi:hypothetical protein
MRTILTTQHMTPKPRALDSYDMMPGFEEGNFCIPKEISSFASIHLNSRNFLIADNFHYLFSWVFWAHSKALYERHNGNLIVNDNVRKMQNLAVVSSCELPLELLRKITKIIRPVLGTETKLGISRMRSRALTATSGFWVRVDWDA